MSKYGNMLAYFLELKTPVEHYILNADYYSGFNSVVFVGIINVIILGDFQDIYVEKNGNLMNSGKMKVYYEKKLPNKSFIKYKNNMYRIIESMDWDLSGGYYRYFAEKVVGDDGRINNNYDIDKGIGVFR